jgi:uncharacterized membrane protein
MRVASVGIQVLLAFLLVVPFQTGWKHVTAFEKYDYFVTLLCIATAAVLLIAPSIHHRLLFRQREKEYVVELGNTLMIVSAVFLTIGFTGILVLLSHVLFGGVAAAIVGGIAGLLIATLWFGIPLNHLRKLQDRR